MCVTERGPPVRARGGRVECEEGSSAAGNVRRRSVQKQVISNGDFDESKIVIFGTNVSHLRRGESPEVTAAERLAVIHVAVSLARNYT